MRGLPAVIAAAWALFAMAAAAQAPSQPLADQARALDGARATLDQVEQALTRRDIPDASLLELRSRLDPLPAIAQSAIDDARPQLDAVKARMAQLGPKPAAGAPPESADVAAERDQQQKQFDAADALSKRAAILATQIEQDAAAIASRRRELFTRALFARTSSAVDPRLWLSVAREAPRDARASRVVAADWIDSAAAKLREAGPALWAGPLLGIVLAFALAARLARRFNPRDPETHDPTPLRKASAAVWVGVIDGAIPVAAVAALNFLFEFFDLVGPRMAPLSAALLAAVVRVAFAASLSRALCAPGLPNWRPIAMTDGAASALSRLAVGTAALVSAGHALEAWLDIVGAGLSPTIALRDATTIATAIVAIMSLRRFAAADSPDDCLPPVVDGAANWRTPLRAATWCATLTIIGAALAGYNAFASFLADQALWVAFLAACALLLREWGQQAIGRYLRADAPLGRAMMSGPGLGRESLDQLAVVSSGALTVAAGLAAGMLVLAPWGVDSDDVLGGLRAAFFGIKVGDVTISLSGVAAALCVFAVAVALTRGLQNWLETQYLPRTRLDSGLRNSIRAVVGYAGVLAALALGMGSLGLSFDKLAIVAGALSVGIGFGLQSIVNNFVSGLVLLWERAIRVGDWVVIGDEQGHVRRINARSTEIETFDRATMIVPNATLVSGVVKNWVRNDRVGRVKAAVAVTMDSDPEKTRDVLMAAAGTVEAVQAFPRPAVFFAAMADNALKFELVCFVGDVETSARVKSDLNFAILRGLREAGIELFLPAAPTEPKKA